MDDEGKSFSKEDVRQLQGHPPQGRGARDLHKPETQTAARLGHFRFAVLGFRFAGRGMVLSIAN
jgi:hypothetical protein